MKKLLYSTLIVLAGLFAVSCEQEHIEAVYNPENVTEMSLDRIPGAILDAESENITASFNPAKFGLPLASSYTLYASATEDFAEKNKMPISISYIDDYGFISMSHKDLNSMVFALGGVADEEFTVYFRLHGYATNDKGNPIPATEVMSNVVSAEFIPYATDIKDVDLYDHVWVIGASSAVGAWSFDKVFQYLYDYDKTGHNFSGVIDFGEEGPSGGFKLTGVGNWDDATKNWGSEAQAEVDEAATVNIVDGGGSKDIKCYSYRYYGFSFDSNAKVLTRLYGFNNVGIVGAFNGWNAGDPDCKMTYNPYYHRFYIDWTFNEDTELKFTCDDSWDLNWGANCVGGGDNIKVGAGSYRIYLDLNKNEIDFNASMFGKDEPGGEEGGDEPDPETYKGWGMIGSFNDWAGDAAMTEANGVWTGYVTLAADAEWKLRKDADWAENFGGTFVALGEPFEAVAGGDNIKIGLDGFFKVVYDSNAGTITVFEGDVWSLIGDFNSWSGDVDMTLVDGKWVSPVTSLTPGWKIRHNHDWEDNFGGVFAEFDAPFEAVAGGDNIDCGEGKFVVTYDPEAGTITVSNAAKKWGVIGDFCGWGEDVDMDEIMPGIWVSPVLDLTGGWKIRFDNGWDINRGGATPSAQGAFVKAVQNGDNIGLEGSFKVVYNANNETIGTLGFGVTGSIASCGINWDNDIPMNLAEDGKYYSIPVALTTADQLKVRWNAAWDVNRGGKCEAADAEFDAIDGGDNVSVPADGTYMVVYDPASEKLTLSTQFWGLVGDFNSWGGDTFMLPLGEGKWAAYNQTLAGGWKCRMSAGWAVNFGGTYESLGTAFPVVQDGSNITCEEEGIDIILDTVAATVTINKL